MHDSPLMSSVRFSYYVAPYFSISFRFAHSIMKSLSNRAQKCAGAFSFATYKIKTTNSLVVFILYVAGARFERAYPGYEPGELPLLYPAAKYVTTKREKNQPCIISNSSKTFR